MKTNLKNLNNKSTLRRVAVSCIALLGFFGSIINHGSDNVLNPHGRGCSITPIVNRASRCSDPVTHIDNGTVYRVDWTAYFPMAKSWSKKKKEQHAGQIHQQKPDRDNVDKAILDAIFKDDSIISDGLLKKRWDDGDGARIEITFYEINLAESEKLL